MSLPDCPYVGLDAYTEEYRSYFFGREEDQKTIAANLISGPLTLLYGASGVGKSSVLMAGVVPFLRDLPDVVVAIFRTWQDSTFIGSLKEEILRAVSEATRRPCVTDRELPLDEFILRSSQLARRSIVIIFDQFEEYFLYHPESPDGNRFDEEFARAVNRAEIDANFCISIREDGLSKLDRFQGRIPNLMSNYLRLEHLTTEAAERAICKPLEEYNTQLSSPTVPISIKSELVSAILTDKRMRAGQALVGQPTETVQSQTLEKVARIETPLLQLVMERLWKEEMVAGSRVLRLDTLNALGGVERIISTHLDKVMENLSEPSREIAARIFRFLVTPSGAKIALSIPDLAALAEVPPPDLPPLLAELSTQQYRILRPVPPPPGQKREPLYEIFHDLLAGPILDWRIRHQAHKELAAARAEAARLKTWIIGAVLDLFLVFPVGALFSLISLKIKRRSLSWKQVGLTALGWIGGWIVGAVLAMAIGGLISEIRSLQEVTKNYIFVCLYLFHCPLGPLASWRVYRRVVPDSRTKSSPLTRRILWTTGCIAASALLIVVPAYLIERHIRRKEQDAKQQEHMAVQQEIMKNQQQRIAKSFKNLIELSADLKKYADKKDHKLPPMKDLDTMRKALKGALGITISDEIVKQPSTGEPYRTNPALSGKPYPDRDTGGVVVLYETSAEGGGRAVILQDGSVWRIPDSLWPELRKLSRIE